MSTNSKRKELRAQAKKKQQLIQRLVIGTLIVAAIAFAVVMLINSYSSSSGSTQEAAVDPALYDKQPLMGDPNAPVKLVEFGDFKCPSCKYFAENVFPKIKADFIDPGIANFRFLNFQFIAEDSFTAGSAAEAVLQLNGASYWAFHEALYRNQGEESKAWATPDFLVEMAKKEQIAVDYDQLRKAIVEKTYEQNVFDDNDLAAKYKVSSTPTLLLNGKILKYEDYEDISAAITKAKEAADKAAANPQ